MDKEEPNWDNIYKKLSKLEEEIKKEMRLLGLHKEIKEAEEKIKSFQKN